MALAEKLTHENAGASISRGVIVSRGFCVCTAFGDNIMYLQTKKLMFVFLFLISGIITTTDAKDQNSHSETTLERQYISSQYSFIRSEWIKVSKTLENTDISNLELKLNFAKQHLELTKIINTLDTEILELLIEIKTDEVENNKKVSDTLKLEAISQSLAAIRLSLNLYGAYSEHHESSFFQSSEKSREAWLILDGLIQQ